MKFEVIKLTSKYLDECVDLFIDTFTREPWNDEYDSKEKVRKKVINCIIS